MNKLFLVCLLALCVSVSYAQKADSVIKKTSGNISSNKNLSGETHRPNFPGGQEGFNRYLANNLICPENARHHRIKGNVTVSFTIEKDGSLSNIKITKSTSKVLDSAALKVIKESPKWIPGMYHGRAVSFEWSTIITFPQPPIAVPKDTSVFYIRTLNNEEVFVKTIDSADYSRVVLPPDTNIDKTLARVNDFYKNGRKKMICDAVIINHHLLLSGPCIEYYENGKRKSIKAYTNGAQSGDFTLYYPNGTLYISGRIDDHGNTIVQEARDSTGNVTVTNGSGNLTRYTADFKRAIESGPIVNGMENGEWRSTSQDSSITFIYHYLNGVFQNGKSFNKLGVEIPFNLFFKGPEFPGGIPAFRNFLAKTIKYPDEARAIFIEGIVYLSFIIDRDGSLINIHILRGAGSAINEEATRVMRSCPKWIPASLNGIPLRIAGTVPINFKLTK